MGACVEECGAAAATAVRGGGAWCARLSRFGELWVVFREWRRRCQAATRPPATKSARRRPFTSSSATKPQKAHVVRGDRKRKTNSRGIEATEKISDSTHVPVSAGSESSLSELDSRWSVINKVSAEVRGPAARQGGRPRRTPDDREQMKPKTYEA